ncbi:MAG: transcriptional repressor [Chloroflexi bacterium]|nr:transcriptional repressor [Chloroflexota bacterium]MBV9600942.1 transcriptional repressor [Chloroflexota bacterium]
MVARSLNRSRADWLLRRLADSGERMTGPREIVVRALVAQSGVVNPEALSYELHPEGVGRATVYRTLDLLERHGMLTRVHVDGCHGYTLCDEGHHHHLLCSTCNTVLPVDATGVEAEILRLAEGLKFRVDTHTLEFSGVCEACQHRAAGT